MHEAEQTELSSPPFDSISSVRFSPFGSTHLLVSSWDATVRFYDVNANEQKAKFDQRAAVLSCCFQDVSHAFSGGLDTYIRGLELETEQTFHLGNHEDSISSVHYATEISSLVSGSWDRTLKFWDPKSKSSQATSSHTLPERIYHMDLVGHTLVVAMASRLFQIWDVRNMQSPVSQRESSLKYMTRAVACMSDQKGYATASVEGRIAVEYVDPSPEIQDKKYAFKCHRQTMDDVDHVWAVNALAFHPLYNTFASAGSDGMLSIWDHESKKRLRQFPKYHSPVSSISFSHDGTKLAIAVCDVWDEGEEASKQAKRPSIFIRALGDEVKPKSMTGK